MGRAQGSYGHGVQPLRTRKSKTRNELEELRKENRQLREFVAHLSEFVLTQIAEAAEPEEQSASVATRTRPEVC